MAIRNRQQSRLVFGCLVLALNLAAACAEDTQPSSPALAFVAEWGRRGAEPGQFHFPIGIAVNAADEVYVTDNINNRVQKFDGNGTLLSHFTVLPNPGEIALDESGNLYLCQFPGVAGQQGNGRPLCLDVFPRRTHARAVGPKGDRRR